MPARAIASLHIPNYRRYFFGALISVSGNWMQNIAEMWLVLELTGNGTIVGLTVAMQFLPLLVAGAWGGLLADRFPKRSLIAATQAAMAIPALALWAVTTTGNVEAWMVVALAFVRGLGQAVDNPARQSILVEIVGPAHLVNAVSLNGVVAHASRVTGPALAALVIAVAGIAPCFLLNACSYGAMVIALLGMNPAALKPAPTTRRAPGAIRAGLRYVIGTPALRTPMAMMAVIGTFSFNFPVLLPVFARYTWEGTASAFAALTASLAIGSVLGAFATGSRALVDERFLRASAAAFGGLSVLTAVTPSLAAMAVALVATGAASLAFAAGTNSLIQLTTNRQMQGRVMGLYSIVFFGSNAVGAPLMGAIAEHLGPRIGLAVGGSAAIVAAIAMRPSDRGPAPAVVPALEEV